jgi:hypothetical protein
MLVLFKSKCGAIGYIEGASALTAKVGTTLFNSAIITYFSTP